MSKPAKAMNDCKDYKLSDCCNAPTDTDILICSDCGEHCCVMCDDCEDYECEERQESHK